MTGTDYHDRVGHERDLPDREPGRDRLVQQAHASRIELVSAEPKPEQANCQRGLRSINRFLESDDGASRA